MSLLDDKLTLLANKIRAKDGVVNTLTLEQMKDTILSIGSQVESTINSIILGTITTIASGVTKIGNSALYRNSYLTSVSFPNATSIGNEAFMVCESLVSADFPNVTSIGDSAFTSCHKLTSSNLNLPKVTSIGNSAFQQCEGITAIPNQENIETLGSSCFYSSNITSINLPKITDLPYSVFNYCSELTEVNLPNVETVGSRLFGGCSKLPSIYLPKIKMIDNGFLDGCTALTLVDIPNLETIKLQSIMNCTSLASLDFPKVTSIGDNAFKGCTILSSLTLRSDTVCVLSSTNAFNNTPISLGTGSIYVPGALYETYKKATNWITFANQIKSYNKYVGELSNQTLLYNDVKTISIPIFKYESPTVTITSSNNSIASISNIVVSSESTTFDLTTHETEGGATITMNVIDGTDTTTRTFTVNVYAVFPHSYTVEDVPNANRNFTLNANGYYESTNKGIPSSYSICKVVIVNPLGFNVYFDCINSGESSFDYGLLSKVGSTLASSSSADGTSSVFKNFKGSSSTSIQTVSYGAIQGTIYVKFIKDSSSDVDNDSLQFKVRFEE